MIELVTAYSFSEIVIFLVILATAIKGVFSFFDWAHKELSRFYGKEFRERTVEEQLETRLCQGDDAIARLTENDRNLQLAINNLNAKIGALIESDRDNIKAFLTKEHHYFCYKQGWIDDYSLECCERCFSHYQQEGGNSFIAGFMEDLRELPHQQPESKT